ncbi:lipoyl protein ligase domain-containing protein [Halosegnis sp.]|uniref:lipoyl protein ligase domain-containing protein n=1 Tax=Halosegnis sp. TaxID=2864959 RepID=UPI0035D49684
MRILRGRAGAPEADRAVTARLAEDVAETDEPAVRVWTPHRQVAFGRRDARAARYEQARRAASARGFPPYERATGGRAVAYTGSTVAFVRLQPVADARQGLTARYESTLAAVERALAAVGVDTERGEPPDAFCPGAHSLSADGKLVGLAQRVGTVARVAGIVVVRDHEAIADVLGPVYDALGVPFDPASVGSVARAGGDADPTAVARALERALASDDAEIERVG